MGLGVVFAGQLSGFVRSTMGDASWRNVYLVQLLIGAVVAAAVLLLIGHRQERLASKSGLGGFSALRRMRGWVPLVCSFTVFGLLYLLVIAFLTTRLEDDNGWTSSQSVAGLHPGRVGDDLRRSAVHRARRTHRSAPDTGDLVCRLGGRHHADPAGMVRADVGAWR